MSEFELHPRLVELANEFLAFAKLPGAAADGFISTESTDYIPFVGKEWDWSDDPDAPRQPRVIVYGMAQNLARHPEEAKLYGGRTRLQDRWAALNALGIKPWQTMHAQVLAAFALLELATRRGFIKPQGCVTEATAYTNYVKWSFQEKSGADKAPEASDYEPVDKFVRAELRALRPDFIIALGRDVHKSFARIGETAVYVRHCSGRVIGSVRSIGRDLMGGTSVDALQEARDADIDRWMQTLDGMTFWTADDRKSADKKGVEVTQKRMREALCKDWLYYALAERQIAAAISGPAAG